MIELGKKYRLKKIKGFENYNNEYYKVIGFYNFDTIICENTYGEKVCIYEGVFNWSTKVWWYLFKIDTWKARIMAEKDYKLYGTKVLNLKTQEIGLLICVWKNKFADAEVDYATCVDKQGKRYNIELDNIRGFEDDFEK